jgi:hypothetical protein
MRASGWAWGVLAGVKSDIREATGENDTGVHMTSG